MPAKNSVSVQESGRSSVSFPRIDSADIPEAADVGKVPLRVDRWRRENPDAVRSWTTKHGCVVLFWGFKVYYGTCTGCGGLVTTRRYVAHDKGDGRAGGGSWPKLCSACRASREEERANRARRTMRSLRERRYAFRDEQMRNIGITPPTQGVAAKNRHGNPIIDYPDDDDDWFEPE